jgi:integrase
MNPKRVQTIMGHANIQITFDTYGHLFRDDESDQKAMEQIQARLMASA